MSEVRTNSITDAAGTGAPDFPNGIEVSAGNVGIGTASPAAKLDVIGDIRLEGTTPALRFAETDTTDLDARVRLQGGDLLFETVTDANVLVRENLRLVDNGAIGIGGANYGTSGQALVSGGSGTAPSWSFPANLSTDRTNWSTNGTISAVVGQLAWKNYNNNHTIFDASNSTSPSGTGVNNTNAAVAWSATYPTLMGWNGSQTYGVRVDSARVADSVGSVSSAQVGSATAGLAYGDVGTYVYGSLLATNIVNGGTYAGSSIVPAGILTPSGSQLTDASGVAAEMNGGGSALSGTWRAMGRSQRVNTTTRARISLFLRIS